MADKKDLDFTYSTIDRIFRLSIGEHGDFSGAMYNGDFTMSLEEAQRKKHTFISDQLNIAEGTKVLDMGCGWGPFLNYIRNHRKAKGIGLTLSQGQYEACLKNGLDVYIRDCKTITPADFGTFDAIVSLGAFEHFCSMEEYREGKQESIYDSFFKTVHSLMPQGGRFFLQTMVFGRNMIDIDKVDINADKDSDAWMIASMVKQFPGSWLPYGEEMITRTAAPYFKVVNSSSGRLDYIETITQWRKKFRKFQILKYALYLSLLPRYITDKAFRQKVDVMRVSANRECFKRELMDHYRIVFEKI
jgi:cyclopropane-fatty-acyl-phospholipid synthase